jgi:hypothetical protein
MEHFSSMHKCLKGRAQVRGLNQGELKEFAFRLQNGFVPVAQNYTIIRKVCACASSEQ